MPQLHVLDLPPLYTHPDSHLLLTTLSQLTLQPASFTTNPPSPTSTSINETGIPNYLTSIISSPLHWIQDDLLREQIWSSASHRIAERAGRTAAPSLTRTFTLSLDEPPTTIHLHEPTLTADNLGHKTWSASYMLATHLTNLAHHIPVSTTRSHKVLELGSGTGLFGIAFAAHFPRTHVLLTDLPDIVPNLARNVGVNAEIVAGKGSSIAAEALDWNDTPLLASSAACLAEYDVVLAADPIYEPSHPELLTRAVAAHLSRAECARFVLGLPLRDAYLLQIEELWALLRGIGLRVLEQGELEGFDDWMDRQGERVLVRVRWAVWGWEEGS